MPIDNEQFCHGMEIISALDIYASLSGEQRASVGNIYSCRGVVCEVAVTCELTAS